MDSFHLRLKFRQDIRKRQIQQLKRASRRSVVEISEKYLEESRLQQLYNNTLKQSNKVYKQPQNYLETLKQALHWRNASHYAQYFPDTLANLLNYYQKKMISEEGIILFVQCVAMIYFYNNLPFSEITHKLISIIMYELNLHKEMTNTKSKLIKSICLICLQNITYYQNKITLQYCIKEKKILQYLQQYIHKDLQHQNQDKEAILQIYNHLIHYYQTKEQNSNFYPNLLIYCFQNTNNSHILEKSVSIVQQLIKNKQYSTQQIFKHMSCLFIKLHQAKFYVIGSDKLLCTALQYLNQNKVIQKKIINNFRMLLEKLAYFYAKQTKKVLICKSFTYLLEIQLYIQIQSLFYYWANLKIYNCIGESFIIIFLQNALSNQKVIEQLYKQACEMMKKYGTYGPNIPTWNIILNFIQNVSLENKNSQEILSFLLIFKTTTMWKSLFHSYSQLIMSKIQRCLRYCLDKNILNKGQQILKIAQQAQNIDN